MDSKALEQINSELGVIATKMTEALERQSQEIKKHGETSSATRDEVKQLGDKHITLEKELHGLSEEFKRALVEAGERGQKQARMRLTPGQQFVQSEAFKAMDERGGDISDRVAVKGLLERKTLLTEASLGDTPMYLWPTTQIPGFFTDPDRDIHIRDLFSSVPTAPSASVQYIRRDNARWLAGMQNRAVSEGLKQEQALDFDIVTEGEKTVAHWIPVTRQVLRNTPMLQNYIDNELRHGILIREDQQILYGAGGAGLNGLMVDADVQELDGDEGPASDSNIDTIRRAITKLRLLYYRPNGVVLNPEDWEEIELAKDDDRRYIWVSVPEGGQARLWRVPVVETPAINAGEYLLGDWSLGAQLWQSSPVEVMIGYINDQFVKNQLSILGEEGVIFTIYLPKAFVRGELNALNEPITTVIGDGGGEGGGEGGGD